MIYIIWHSSSSLISWFFLAFLMQLQGFFHLSGWKFLAVEGLTSQKTLEAFWVVTYGQKNFSRSSVSWRGISISHTKRTSKAKFFDVSTSGDVCSLVICIGLCVVEHVMKDKWCINDYILVVEEIMVFKFFSNRILFPQISYF